MLLWGVFWKGAFDKLANVFTMVLITSHSFCCSKPFSFKVISTYFVLNELSPNLLDLLVHHGHHWVNQTPTVL